MKKLINQLTLEHHEITVVMRNIEWYLEESLVISKSNSVSILLQKLTSLLTFHLLKEDKEIYQYFLNHDEHQIRQIAIYSLSEVEKIIEDYRDFHAKWNQRAIENAPMQFITDIQSIFNKISIRIEKESKVIFPLFTLLIINKNPNDLTEKEIAQKEIKKILKEQVKEEQALQIMVLKEIAKKEENYQDSRWLFRNYQKAIQYYREAFALGDFESRIRYENLLSKS